MLQNRVNVFFVLFLGTSLKQCFVSYSVVVHVGSTTLTKLALFGEGISNYSVECKFSSDGTQTNTIQLSQTFSVYLDLIVPIHGKSPLFYITAFSGFFFRVGTRVELFKKFRGCGHSFTWTAYFNYLIVQPWGFRVLNFCVGL